MILFPGNWREVGQPIALKKIESTILEILAEINCNSLALSGGVDSSLLLYYLLRVKNPVNVFTIGRSHDHPDVVYSELAVNHLSKDGDITHRTLIPQPEMNRGGSEAVKRFYGWVSKYTDGIIAGDGIDEFTCGYYPHQKNPVESEYYYHLNRLLPDHLIPLDKNSGNVNVFLPYLDQRLITLFSQIPICDKVDTKQRKKIIVALAKDKLPQIILDRWKYGFCDALNIKEKRYENPA